MPVVGLFLDSKKQWSPEELQGFAKTWRTKYSAIQRSKHAISCGFSTDIRFFCTIRHIYRSVWPATEAKPRFGTAFVGSAHDCEIRYFDGYQTKHLVRYGSLRFTSINHLFRYGSLSVSSSWICSNSDFTVHWILILLSLSNVYWTERKQMAFILWPTRKVEVPGPGLKENQERW